MIKNKILIDELVKKYFSLDKDSRILFHLQINEQENDAYKIEFMMTYKQQSLGKEFEDILNDNLWELYIKS